MNATRLAMLLLVLGALAPAPCRAGPPFVTDDPEPVELHHTEIYIASMYLHSLDGATYSAPHLEYNYGAAPNLQLHIIAPMQRFAPNSGPSSYGYGDTELGIKYRFIQETRSRPQVGIFPLAEVPTGDANKGLGNGQAQYFFPVWVQKSAGAWTTYGGGGYWVNLGAGNRDYWFAGWALQRDLNKAVTLGAEIYHTTPQTTLGTNRNAFNIGAIYNFDEVHHLLLSAGRDFDAQNVGAYYAAYQWTLGPTSN